MKLRPFARSLVGPLGLSSALVAGIAIAPAPSFADELNGSSIGKATQNLYKSKPLLGVAPDEIQRGNAYARLVWMPQVAAGSVGGSGISFGLARLNPLVRRGFGVGSSALAAVAAPVVSLQLSRNTSVTFIKLLGDADGGMVALQMKLGN